MLLVKEQAEVPRNVDTHSYYLIYSSAKSGPPGAE